MLNDEEKLDRIRAALDVSLAEIGASEDISFEIGNMRYDANGTKCKMTVTMYTGTKTKCRSQRDLESAGTVRIYHQTKPEHITILSEDIGNEFTVSHSRGIHETFTLVGWISRGRKYNWVGKDSSGESYKFTNEQLYPFAEGWRRADAELQ